MDLSAFMSGQVLAFFLAYARIGTALMFMPGFGESMIPMQVRLLAGLVISLALFPALPLPELYDSSVVTLASVLGIEITIGVWIGVMARILMSALQLAGFQVGQVSALANAFAPESEDFQGATLVASFLIVIGLALIFITNTHHIMLRALISSYDVFEVGVYIAADMSSQAVRLVTHSLYIGMSLAAPFYVLGVLNNVGLGLANRMMPTLPVFFVASSLLIIAGLSAFSLAAPWMLDAWLEDFINWFASFRV